MTTDPKVKRESLNQLLQNLDVAARGVEVYKTDEDVVLENEKPIHMLRRGGQRRPPDDPIAMITLTEVENVLQWEEGTGIVSIAGPRMRRGAVVAAPSGDIVAQYKFEKLEPNKVGAFLSKLDDKLTPTPGLRRLDKATRTLTPCPPPSSTGKKTRRTLVLVHGTFSNNDHLLAEINDNPKGADFVTRLLAHYDNGVYAFDHPTISVSPVLNAIDLARLFAGFDGPIDVICHSRGGLVVRWWLEVLGRFAGGAHRAVLVGSPLAGTGLASPPRLRAAIGLITNVGHALSIAGSAASLAVPILSVAVGLVKVVTSIASLGEKAPLVDAAVAMIPGLASQSMVSNNAELRKLHTKTDAPVPDYFAVTCNFETEDPGWAFWRRFRKMNLADTATDTVFDGNNDLVVDSDSMTLLFEGPVQIPKARIRDFGTTSKVHHTNYFRQPETLAFITKSLGIP